MSAGSLITSPRGGVSSANPITPPMSPADSFYSSVPWGLPTASAGLELTGWSLEASSEYQHLTAPLCTFIPLPFLSLSLHVLDSSPTQAEVGGAPPCGFLASVVSSLNRLATVGQMALFWGEVSPTPHLFLARFPSFPVHSSALPVVYHPQSADLGRPSPRSPRSSRSCTAIGAACGPSPASRQTRPLRSACAFCSSACRSSTQPSPTGAHGRRADAVRGHFRPPPLSPLPLQRKSPGRGRLLASRSSTCKMAPALSGLHSSRFLPPLYGLPRCSFPLAPDTHSLRPPLLPRTVAPSSGCLHTFQTQAGHILDLIGL